MARTTTPQWKRRMDTHIRVGLAIRQIRSTGELTQSYVAKFVGCSPSSVSALERGKYGSLELLEVVTWALGIDLGHLKLTNPKALPSINRARRRAAA